MNVGLMGLTGLNLILRRNRGTQVGILPMLLSVAGNVGLLVSSWYGGHMVYEHGMRVKGVSEVEEAAELKPAGDEKLTEAGHRLKELAPG